MDIMKDDILEKLLVSRLNLIRQIQEFMPNHLSHEVEDITDLLMDYNFGAQTLRKIERKYTKKWF